MSKDTRALNNMLLRSVNIMFFVLAVVASLRQVGPLGSAGYFKLLLTTVMAILSFQLTLGEDL